MEIDGIDTIEDPETRKKLENIVEKEEKELETTKRSRTIYKRVYWIVFLVVMIFIVLVFVEIQTGNYELFHLLGKIPFELWIVLLIIAGAVTVIELVFKWTWEKPIREAEVETIKTVLEYESKKTYEPKDSLRENAPSLRITRKTIPWFVILIAMESGWIYYSYSRGFIPLFDLEIMLLAQGVVLCVVLALFIYYIYYKPKKPDETILWNPKANWQKFSTVYHKIFLVVILIFGSLTALLYYFPLHKRVHRYEFLFMGEITIIFIVLYFWALYNVWIRKRNGEIE